MGLKRTSDGKAINSVDEAVEATIESPIITEEKAFEDSEAILIQDSGLEDAETEIEIVVDESDDDPIDEETNEEE